MKAENDKTEESESQGKRIAKAMCPDYDKDCKSMSVGQATWCFLGCQNHPCYPNGNLDTAKGVCPIIHSLN